MSNTFFVVNFRRNRVSTFEHIKNVYVYLLSLSGRVREFPITSVALAVCGVPAADLIKTSKYLRSTAQSRAIRFIRVPTLYSSRKNTLAVRDGFGGGGRGTRPKSVPAEGLKERWRRGYQQTTVDR